MNISVLCPACGEEGEHQVLKGGVELLVECPHCRHVHRVIAEKIPAPLKVRTIVSTGETSQVCQTELDSETKYRLGDMVVVECGEEAIPAEITAIEVGEQRVDRARGSEIQTVWTRAVEEVVVKLALHAGRTTQPVYLRCTGEERFEVGERYQMGEGFFRISHIKLRNDRFLRREGQTAEAKSIKRIYGFRAERTR
jgi:uncharacterized Zn finger protein